MVRNGNINDSILTGKNPEGRQFIGMPVYGIKPDGKAYIGAWQCTKQFKLKPIHRYLRNEYLKAPTNKAIRDTEVRMWLSISRDDASRQKPSSESWITNVYPLLERDYSREQMKMWFEQRYRAAGCPSRRASDAPTTPTRPGLE